MREKIMLLAVILISVAFPVRFAHSQLSGNIETGFTYFKVGIHEQPSVPVYEYTVATNDSEVIAQCLEQLSLPEDLRDLHINGAIDWGDGGFNTSWSWHIVPDDWHLAGMSAEVCDGSPQFVEENLEYWINAVGRYCCYDSYIKGQVKIGDVNGDGAIDILDVMFVVNIILELTQPTPDQIWAADSNNDGVVDIFDIFGIVEIILGNDGLQ
ncbi:MAG: dockerin type I repeat-containing protein [Gemmatimonadota bacterium]|nr:MAG: dockerin type I repeat-containing protein [Gemmatimonadota bacterium]